MSELTSPQRNADRNFSLAIDPDATNMVPYGKGFGMIRSSQTIQISHRRHALRVALCVAMTANAGLALADSGFEAQPQPISNSSCDVPVYPFPIASDANASTRPSNKIALVRLLGFTSNNKGKSSTGCGLPQVAQPTIAVQQPAGQPAVDLMTPSLPSTTKVDVEDRLPQLLPDLSMQAFSPQASTPVALLSTVQQSTLPDESAVIAANATRPVQAVQESMSDSSKSTPDALDALDLVNSLDDIMSPPVKSGATQPQPTGFKDSIQIDYSSSPTESSEESGISLNMSDREQSPSVPKSKAPQLVNTKQSRSLRTTSAVPGAVASRSSDEFTSQDTTASQVVMSTDSLPQLDRLPQRLQPSGGLATFPMTTPTQPPTTQATGTASESSLEPQAVENQPDFSSRRESKPEAMKIRIEGEPATTYSPPRQPLVPLLALATGRARLPERASSQQLSQSTAPAESARTTTPSTEVAGKDVSVTVRDSVSLQSAETIQALSVEHEDVCQIIQTGGRAYSVIGLQPGETRVAVITESAGQRKVQIQHVKVGAAQATERNSSSIASDISQTIQQLYPRNEVRITTRETQLVVAGVVDSENTAKKILSLIRKTTLTPVLDELQIK